MSSARIADNESLPIYGVNLEKTRVRCLGASGCAVAMK